MIISLQKVLEINRNLNSISDYILPSKLGYAISYNMELLSKEVERIDREREKIIKRYAEKDENGEPLIKQQDGRSVYELGNNVATFVEEFNSLLSEEISIDFRTVNQDVIDMCDNDRYTHLSILDMKKLFFMIEE